MKRFAVFAVSGLIVATMWTPPAAAVTSTKVISCRGGNPTCWPAAFAFAGRRIFYVERFTGKIRELNQKTGRHKNWGRVSNVDTGGEKGLLGLALDPRWGRGRRYRWVYLYYTHASPFQNRIIRMRKERGGGFKKQVLARIPAAGNHNGGVIHFGPDGRLWSVTGDAGNKANAQAFNNLAGKLNRMTPKGGTPGDNPLMPNSARTQIWSFGHRNSFGFTFDPQTGEPWQTENGPNCNDEINHPAGGQNRAWGPSESCPNTNQDGPLPRVGPEWNFSSVIAPTGAAFCQGCELGGSVEGKLLFGAFNDDRIRSATLNAGRDDITAVNNLYLHSRFILAVERRASGSVWFSDDRGIYRLDP